MKQLCTTALAYGRSLGPRSFLALFCFWILTGTGCMTVRPDFVAPSVSVTSFKPLLSPGLAPRFEIGMRVVNPNSAKVHLRSMSYKLYLNDYMAVEGAASKLPDVPEYGKAEFKVIAAIGLFESVSFVNDMLQYARGKVIYRLLGEIDAGIMEPAIRIDDVGSFSP